MIFQKYSSMRSPSSRTSRISGLSPTGSYGSSSDIDGGNFEGPSDISDVAGLGGEIGGNRGTPPRRPPMGGIDLGKGLDLEKPRPPRAGIGFEVAKSPQGNVGIGVEIPLPVAAPISGRGGVSIDPATGGIRGGYGGLGIGRGPIGASVDVGVDTAPGGGLGCFKYVTVAVGPFSHTFGKNECEPKEQEKNPQAPGGTGLSPGALSPQQIDGVMLTTSCGRVCVLLHNHFETDYENPYVTGTENICFKPRPVIDPETDIPTGEMIAGWDSEYINEIYYVEDVKYSLSKWDESFKKNSIGTSWDYYTVDPLTRSQCFPEAPSPPASPPSSFSPPLPNPPPTKKKMDDKCCKLMIALQLETLKQLGRNVTKDGLGEMKGQRGMIGEKIKRIETPIKNGKKPKEIEITFPTLYQMLAYMLKQSNNLDAALDPQSYKVPEGYIQNPKYNRDSEKSLKSNSQPRKDNSGEKRELEINEDSEIKIGGFLEQQQYVFDALKRLEYLFPSGELADAQVSKDLLIPGGKGDIKIHNMIMAYEIQMMYLNATMGNPREALVIKDANPAIKGDQPIEVKSLSISDMLRQGLKFHIDTGGDVDAMINLVLRDFRTNLAMRIDQIKSAEMIQALFEDSGMLEKQEYIKIHLEGDPYAGQWVKGEGFKANPDLEKKTEEATEKVLQETLKPTDIKIKVSKRSKDEKTDMRDLLRGLADFIQRLLSIPTAGDTAKAVDKLIESAKFKVQTEMALIRQNVAAAATASRNRTRKKKK